MDRLWFTVRWKLPAPRFVLFTLFLRTDIQAPCPDKRENKINVERSSESNIMIRTKGWEGKVDNVYFCLLKRHVVTYVDAYCPWHCVSWTWKESHLNCVHDLSSFSAWRNRVRVISFSYAWVFSIDLLAEWIRLVKRVAEEEVLPDEQEEGQICALAPLHIHVLAFDTTSHIEFT